MVATVPTLVKVKRRRGEDALDALVLSTVKRSRVERTEILNNESVDSTTTNDTRGTEKKKSQSVDEESISSAQGVVTRVFRFYETLGASGGETASAKDYLSVTGPNLGSRNLAASAKRVSVTAGGVHNENVNPNDERRARSRQEMRDKGKKARLNAVLNRRSGFIEMWAEGSKAAQTIPQQTRDISAKHSNGIPMVRSSVQSYINARKDTGTDANEFVYDIYYEDRQVQEEEQISLKDLEGYCVQVEAFEEDLIDAGEHEHEYGNSQDEDSNDEDYIGNDYPDEDDQIPGGFGGDVDLTSDDDSDLGGSTYYRSGRTGQSCYDSDSDGNGSDVDPYSFVDVENELSDIGYGL
eukprot:CFRG6087T1